MKITALTAEELELKEGSGVGLIIGGTLTFLGLFFATVLHSFGTFSTLVGLAALAAGVAMILFSSSITLNANRRNGQLRYEKKRIVGAKQSLYSIADVSRVETRREWMSTESTDSEGSTSKQNVLTAQSLIVFRDGRLLAISHQRNASKSHSTLASQVAQFLNVPFYDLAPNNR